MSFRIQGIINAFEVASGTAASREIGQLVRITNAGKATTGTGEGDKLFFPVTEKLDHTADKVVGAQVTGVAKVYVETAAGITAGSRVSIGATFLGVRQEQANPAFILGIALATPSGDGDYIPVLLQPSIDEIV